MTSTTRRPAVAGSFYPGEPEELMAAVDTLLADAERAGGGAQPAPKALIVPHAGYIYSGAVAARAYRLLRPLAGRLERVVLIGPAHRAWLTGIAAPEAAGFATPLGTLLVDQEAVAAIADLPYVQVSDAVHAEEHSLEVQLPFLQRVLGLVHIVPLLVGDATPREVVSVLDRLWDGAGTVILVSSDLSHYHGYDAARRFDAMTATCIETLQGDGLGPGHACGCLPISGLIAEAKRHGLAVERLDLRNSGDTAGPRHEVVGYGAWAFREAA